MELMPLFPACRTPLKPNQPSLGPADNCLVDLESHRSILWSGVAQSDPWMYVLVKLTRLYLSPNIVLVLSLFSPLFADFFAINRNGRIVIRWRLPHWLKCVCLLHRRTYREKIKTFLPSSSSLQRLSSFTSRSPSSSSQSSVCRSITTQLDEIIAKYFYLFCATELILKGDFQQCFSLFGGAPPISSATNDRREDHHDILGQVRNVRPHSPTSSIELKDRGGMNFSCKKLHKSLGVHLNRFSAVL